MCFQYFHLTVYARCSSRLFVFWFFNLFHLFWLNRVLIHIFTFASKNFFFFFAFVHFFSFLFSIGRVVTGGVYCFVNGFERPPVHREHSKKLQSNQRIGELYKLCNRLRWKGQIKSRIKKNRIEWNQLVHIVIAVGAVVVGIAQSVNKSSFPIKLKIAFTHLHSHISSDLELENEIFRRCSHFASIELIRSQLKRVAITWKKILWSGQIVCVFTHRTQIVFAATTTTPNLKKKSLKTTTHIKWSHLLHYEHMIDVRLQKKSKTLNVFSVNGEKKRVE